MLYTKEFIKRFSEPDYWIVFLPLNDKGIIQLDNPLFNPYSYPEEYNKEIPKAYWKGKIAEASFDSKNQALRYIRIAKELKGDLSKISDYYIRN